MRIATFALVCLGFATQGVRAFTNGTLLPSYICNNADGYPKSAGTLIPFLQLGTAADGYNQFPPGNSTTVLIKIGGVNANPGDAIAPTARQIIGAFHNGGLQQNAAGNQFNPINYETPSMNPVWLAPNMSNPANGAGTYTIIPGKINTFVVAAHCPAPDPRGFNNAGVALDGFMAYAIDTATGQRIGSWVNVGPTLTNWYACNPHGTAFESVGIVHNQLVSGNSNVAGLTWMAPATIQGTVQFKGAGVSDCAFGPFSVIYNTTTNMTAPSPAAQGLTPNQGALAGQLAPYVLKDAAPDLPGSAQAVTVLATGTPAMTQPGAMPMMYTPLQTAGIAIAGAVIGAVVIGGVMFALGKRSGATSQGAVLL